MHDKPETVYTAAAGKYWSEPQTLGRSTKVLRIPTVSRASSKI